MKHRSRRHHGGVTPRQSVPVSHLVVDLARAGQDPEQLRVRSCLELRKGLRVGDRHRALDRRLAERGEERRGARRVQSASLRRCLVIRNAARRRSSHGSASVQRKFARAPFCCVSGLSLGQGDRHGFGLTIASRVKTSDNMKTCSLDSGSSAALLAGAALRRPPAGGARRLRLPPHGRPGRHRRLAASPGSSTTIHVDRGSRRHQGAAALRRSTLASSTPTSQQAKEDMDLTQGRARPRAGAVGRQDLEPADLDAKRAAVRRWPWPHWEKAKTIRDYAVIRAPFAGVVTEKYARVGQKVIEDQNEPLFKITRLRAAPRPHLRARGGPPDGPPRRHGRGRSRPASRRRGRPGRSQFISPTVDAGERDLPGRRPGPPRSGAAGPAARASRSRSVSRARRQQPDRMADARPRGAAPLRSTLDRVLVHDIKNMGFRLQMLRSNLDEHYGDPDFKRSVQELLAATVERLDGIVGRWSAHEDARPDQGRPRPERRHPRGRVGTPRRGAGPPTAPAAAARLAVLSLALGRDPAGLGRSLLPARRAREPGRQRARGGGARRQGPRSAASPTRNVGRRPRAIVEIIDNGAGMSPEFVRDRLFQPVPDDEAGRRRARPLHRGQIVRHHGGTIRVRSQAPDEGTVVRLLVSRRRPDAEP